MLYGNLRHLVSHPEQTSGGSPNYAHTIEEVCVGDNECYITERDLWIYERDEHGMPKIIDRVLALTLVEFALGRKHEHYFQLMNKDFVVVVADVPNKNVWGIYNHDGYLYRVFWKF